MFVCGAVVGAVEPSIRPCIEGRGEDDGGYGKGLCGVRTPGWCTAPCMLLGLPGYEEKFLRRVCAVYRGCSGCVVPSFVRLPLRGTGIC